MTSFFSLALLISSGVGKSVIKFLKLPLSRNSKTSEVSTTSCLAKFNKDNYLASLNKSLLMIPFVLERAGI